MAGNLVVSPKSVYSLLCSVTGSSPSSSFSPNLFNCSSPRELSSVYADYLRSHLSFSLPKALRSRARGYLSKLRQATCPEKCHSSFCSPFSSTECLVADSDLFTFTATCLNKVAYPIPMHLPRSAIDFLLHIVNLGLYVPYLLSERHLLLLPSISWESLLTLLLPSGLSLSPRVFQSCLKT